MAGHDLGLVVRCLDVGVGGADQASDVAAVGKVDRVVAAGVAEGVAGDGGVGVVRKSGSLAVCVCIVDVIELRLAAAHFHRLRAASVSVGRQCVRRLGGQSRTSGSPLGALPAARRTLMLSCATTVAPSLWNAAFPPV